MNAKKTLMALALVGAVGIGVVGAQPGSPRGGNPGGNPPDNGRGRGTMLQEREREWMRDGTAREVVSAVVEATGLDAAAVAQALREGSTPADLIAANGGDVGAVTADVIAILTARVESALENGRITQERADAMIANIEEHVTQVISGEVPGFGGVLRDRFMMGLRPDRMSLIEAAMEATSLTRGQILGQLIDGATLGSVITDNGGDVNAIIAAAAANATERLDQAVTNGRITQDEADQLLQRLNEMLQDVMNGTLRQSRGLL